MVGRDREMLRGRGGKRRKRRERRERRTAEMCTRSIDCAPGKERKNKQRIKGKKRREGGREGRGEIGKGR